MAGVAQQGCCWLIGGMKTRSTKRGLGTVEPATKLCSTKPRFVRGLSKSGQLTLYSLETIGKSITSCSFVTNIHLAGNAKVPANSKQGPPERVASPFGTGSDLLNSHCDRRFTRRTFVTAQQPLVTSINSPLPCSRRSLGQLETLPRASKVA